MTTLARLVMQCALCKEKLWYWEILVHDVCVAVYDKRLADGKCIGCGKRNAMDRGWCGVCPDQVYSGYPGRK